MKHRFGVLAVFVATSFVVATAFASKAKLPPAKKKPVTVDSVSENDVAKLKSLDEVFQTKSMKMKVDKVVKIALLDQEKKSNGTMTISSGRLRLELDGPEKTMLIVNKKNLWSITYPPAEFKDAALQVIKANVTNKKGQSQNFVSLLTQGGFLKFFTATAAMVQPDKSVLYFLSPKTEQTDFKRAQVQVSSDGKKILALNYWDDRNNETRLTFSDLQFEMKVSADLFDYTPPANADVMNL